MRLVVVEDNKTTLSVLTCLAQKLDECEVVPFMDPQRALVATTCEGCDLILVDYLMPGMNGVDFVRVVRANPNLADVPVVMLTTEGDRAVRQAAIDAGATDFLTKPVDPIELKMRLRNLLMMRKAMVADKLRAKWLTQEVAAATATVLKREEEIIMRMVRAIEFRDLLTGAHVDRIGHYSKLIAEKLGLPAGDVKEIALAAPMHDVGKLAVPDAILLKPGPLTAEEWSIMQQHTVRGHAILAGSEASLLRRAAEIALSHHERYDGGGYPHGLKGDAIPLSARIVAVADVYDALTSERPYKSAWSAERARDYLVEKSGTQFDPDCVAAFLEQVHGTGWQVDAHDRSCAGSLSEAVDSGGLNA